MSLICAGALSCASAPPIAVPPAHPHVEDAVRVASPYPPARVTEAIETIHGVAIADPYQWLEDDRSAEVKEWVGKEDALTRDKLAALPERSAIAERLAEILYSESLGLPVVRGKNVFVARHDAGKEKAIVYARENGGPESAVLDPNAWSSDGAASLAMWNPSPDGSKIAYAMTFRDGRKRSFIQIYDVVARTNDREWIVGASRVSWSPKGDGFYYATSSTAPAMKRTIEVRFHQLGTAQARDPIVYDTPADSTTSVQCQVSGDGHFLFVDLEHAWSWTEILFRDLRKPSKEWVQLTPSNGAKYTVTAWADRFYVRTNDGAPRFRLFRVDASSPKRESWREIVAEDPTAVLETVSVVGGALSLSYLRNVTSSVEIRDLDGKKLRDVLLPGMGTATLFGSARRDASSLVFGSFTTPLAVYDASVATGSTKLRQQTHVRFDPTAFAVEQIFATSADGTRVPAFVIHKNDLVKDGSAPALVTGYGGFGVSLKPAFAAIAVPWIERGGIYVVANLRGGGEYGEAWHEAGTGHQKQNVFDDLNAVVTKLIADRFTSPSRIALRGGSNGGLLVGTAITQHPELYRVAICDMPLLDMIRYERFNNAASWVHEYGTVADHADFDALRAYSPYHHVRAGTKYPSLLVTSADNDERVAPLHAWKFTAMVQARTTGGPVYLRVEKNSTHTGADLVRAQVEMLADELAFAWNETHEDHT